MKRLLYLGLAALMLPAFVACRSGKATSVEIDWQDGEMLAVAFLGYYDSYGTFEASASYARLTQYFPQIVEASQVKGLGRELYLVVPRDPMATLAVDDSEEQVCYRSEEGDPVLLLCNWARPDRQVVCTDNEGHTTIYMPAIDSRTGMLKTPADGSVHDISLPPPTPLADYVSCDYEDVLPGSGIHVHLEAGQPVLSCSAAALEDFGYPEDSFVLRDGDNYFSGIDGLCKGVFIGGVGYDENPVIFVVMANGEVKMTHFFYAVQHGGPTLSGALPGCKDVTGFERGHGEDVNEDTGESYEYDAVFALDARGGRTQLQLFPRAGHTGSTDGQYEVFLTPDWQFAMTHFYPEDDLVETYNGTFSPAEEVDGAMAFPFRLLSYSRFQHGDTELDEHVKTGKFLVRPHDADVEVSVQGVDAFPDGTVFVIEY